jgi:phosphatidylserine/phosphatidylglycerophosphate/cardiolipin synthase-like enzyme
LDHGHSANHPVRIGKQRVPNERGTGDDYDVLLKTIAARVAAGVDVRLIESAEYGEKWAEKMKAQGVDLTANIRLQHHVHNKSFVIDSQQVVVASQNYSPAGVEQNRDAGVIIEHQGIAQYYEKVFLADWNNQATPFVASGVRAKGRPKAGASPGGSRRKKSGARSKK